MQLDWVHHDAKTDIFEEASQTNIRKLIEIDAQFHNVLALPRNPKTIAPFIGKPTIEREAELSRHEAEFVRRIKVKKPPLFKASMTLFNAPCQSSTCSNTEFATITSYRSCPISVSSMLPSLMSGSIPYFLPRFSANSTSRGLISSPSQAIPFLLQRIGNHPMPVPISRNRAP